MWKTSPEADDSNLDGASGGEALVVSTRERPGRPGRPAHCALASYALSSIHRKIPRQVVRWLERVWEIGVWMFRLMVG